MGRCAGITAKGTRCQLDALAGAEWCYSHDPRNAEARSRNARRAGRIGGRGRPGALEISEIKRSIRSTVDGVLAGRIQRSTGAVAFQGFTCLLRAVEVERRAGDAELEQRLDALERHLVELAEAGEGRWVG
jgi:hypothetical protein